MAKEKKKGVQSPHDSFFKQVFSDKEKAADLLKGNLPKEIIDQLDWNSLTLNNTSFVDEELKNHFADLVYECHLNEDQKIKVALLFEHKSYLPAYPHLQLLRYLLRIWETQAKSNQPLQIVIPIIIYHGQQEWKLRPFEWYFAGHSIPEAYQRFVPGIEYLLEDLYSEEDEQLRNRFKLLTVEMALLLMKHIGSPNILERLPFIFQGAKELASNEQGRSYIQILKLYLYYSAPVAKEKVKEVMENILHSTPLEGSVAWQWKQEGKQEGILEGQEKTKVELVKKMLLEGIPIDVISKITEFSKEEILKIQNS